MQGNEYDGNLNRIHSKNGENNNLLSSLGLIEIDTWAYFVLIALYVWSFFWYTYQIVTQREQESITAIKKGRGISGKASPHTWTLYM